MSLIWSQALHIAYPDQEAHYRPSKIGACGRQQAAGVKGIPPTDTDYSSGWAQQMGHSGQDVAAKAIPYLGFTLEEHIDIEGPLPGEGDLVLETVESNVFGWPVGEKWLGEVKCRTIYTYAHIWEPNGDLLSFDPLTAIQANTYAGQRGIKNIVLFLFPFDATATKRDIEWTKGRSNNTAAYDVNHMIRVMTTEFNPSLFVLTLERLELLKQHGLDVFPEYDPTQGKFPCTYCGFNKWCRERGPGGKVELPEIPNSGMQLKEWELP